MIVTVFGGTGFLGKFVVHYLTKNKHQIRLAARNIKKAQQLNILGAVGQIGCFPWSIHSTQSLEKAVQGADAVVNAVGILNQSRKSSFEKVHVEFPEALAKACVKYKVPKLVHVSSMGASKHATSRYGESKFAGDQKVHDITSTASIVAPNAIFGHEDKFFNLFAFAGKISPLVPIVGKGNNKLNPVYVGDVAKLISQLLTQEEETEYTRHQVQGAKNYTMKELVQMTLNQLKIKRKILPVPATLASFGARLAENIPFITPPFSRDSIKMATQDLYMKDPADNALLKYQIPITPIEKILPTYIS